MTEEEIRQSINSQLRLGDSRRDILEFVESHGISKETARQWIKEESTALLQIQIEDVSKNKNIRKRIAGIILVLGIAGNLYCFFASGSHFVVSAIFIAMVCYGLIRLFI